MRVFGAGVILLKTGDLMPATITHFLMTKRLEKKLQDTGIPYVSSSLYWGAQGPDVLFFHKPLTLRPKSSLRGFGMSLHKTDPMKTFTAMRNYIMRCPENEKVAAFSYAYGFLSHLSLDSTAHPYVYYFQKLLAGENGAEDKYMHHKIESNIDVIMLRKELSRAPKSFDIKEALPDDSKADKGAMNIQSKMLAEVINELYPDKKVKKGQVKKAFLQSRRYIKLMLDKKGRKVKLMHWIERKQKLGLSLSCFIRPEIPQDDFDYINENHLRWEQRGVGTSKVSSVDFYSLFEKASSDSEYLISRFRECTLNNQPVFFLSDYRFHNGSDR